MTSKLFNIYRLGAFFPIYYLKRNPIPNIHN